MEQRFQQFSSILMALLVLLSTVSWTVEKHLCMGRVMDVALFGHAEDCGMETNLAAFGETENHCCEDESFTLEGQDDLKVSFDQLSFDQQVFLTAFVYSYIDRAEGFDENIIPFKDYAPPPLIRDVQILDQSFLI